MQEYPYLYSWRCLKYFVKCKSKCPGLKGGTANPIELFGYVCRITDVAAEELAVNLAEFYLRNRQLIDDNR